jgi:hypothetical protein
MKKRIAITINDVIRRYYDTFKEVYNVYLEEEEQFNEEKIDRGDDFEFGELDDEGDIQQITENKIENKILNLEGKVDPMYITSKIELQSKEFFLRFLYEQMSFEIGAKTNVTYKDVISDFHELQNYFNSKGIEIDLVSMEIGNSKPATLFFLSREKCKLNNLRFVSSYEDIWDDYKMIITADNYIIENKPKNRKLFKIETENNKHLKQGKKIKNLKALLNIFKNGK